MLSENRTAHKPVDRINAGLRAARWTVWDWPRGGHSNVASTATPGSGSTPDRLLWPNCVRKSICVHRLVCGL